MSEVEDQIKEYFNVLVPKLASHLRDDFYKFEYEYRQPKDTHFSSGIYFLKIKFWIKNDNKNKDEKDPKTTIMQFVAKTPITCESMQKFFKIECHFHNEVLFYRNYMTENDNYPKCIYIDDIGSTLASTLILEDVSNRGYALYPQKVNIPMDDIIVVMKEIARFHAKGYVMKEQQPEKFLKLIEDIQECQYESEDKFVELNQIINRAVNYLRKQNYDRNVCDKLDEFLTNAYSNIILKTIKPVEPLAVLCHGDFTINNMLFKRNEKESQVLLIDFALIRYSSPAIDLSTFLCLSCINQVKCNNFSMVLRAYHDELMRCLKESGLTDLDKYSYEAFYNDYVENALIGFFISSYFLQILISNDIPPLSVLLEKNSEEIVNLLRRGGGEEVSKLLADLLLDLKELGCFNRVLS